MNKKSNGAIFPNDLPFDKIPVFAPVSGAKMKLPSPSRGTSLIGNSVRNFPEQKDLNAFLMDFS